MDWSTTIVVMAAFDSWQLASLRSLTEVFGPMCLILAELLQRGVEPQGPALSKINAGSKHLEGMPRERLPFVFGFTVYESFESQPVAKTGIVPMPSTNERVVGGHAVMAVGYDDSTQQFIVRNSWATTWGIKGYFMMPYSYLTDSNLADDFWTIRTVQ